jgi:glycosyltransferase involved in cell wall biosynthesis
MARLAVIVPTFNRVGYLAETIASVLSQDDDDFELIVVDNASTDATSALIGGVADPRLRYVRRAHDLGWRENFNQALRDAQSTSEYVALVADDDRLLPGSLTRAVKVLDASPAVGFVHTTFNVVDAEGRVVVTNADQLDDVPVDMIQRGSEFISRTMRSGTPVCLSSAVMRTAALPEECFAAGEEVCGDLVLFLGIALDWDVGFLATPGIDLRVHPGQLSNSFDTAEHIAELREAKLRFVAANSNRLDDVGALRRSAREYTAVAMTRPVWTATRESRSEGFRALRRAIRERPQLLFSSTVWRAAVRVAVGPRLVRSIHARRAAE